MNINYVDYIDIDENLRLIKYDKIDYSVAEDWYKDKEILYYSEGEDATTYDKEKIEKMYGYLLSKGELYFIQSKKDRNWVTIGDATLLENNLPIVIGDKDYWSCGVGRKVIKALIEKGKAQGMNTFRTMIYNYNDRSKAMFKSVGFKFEKTEEKNEIYVLNV